MSRAIWKFPEDVGMNERGLAHPDNWPTFVSAAAPVTRKVCRCARLSFPHRFSAACSERAELETDEAADNAKRDRAIERGGDPDREHDSRGWE